MPYKVTWDITYGCNLRCKFCLLPTPKPAKNELSTSEALRLVDSLSSGKVFMLSFSGGEPLVREDFFMLAERAATKGLLTTLGTNGTLVDKAKAAAIKKVGIRGVQVSLDGNTPKINDAVRGEGTFLKIVEGINNLTEQKIPVMVACVLLKQNKDDILNLIDFVRTLGCKGIKLEGLIPEGRGATNFDKFQLTKNELKEVYSNAWKKKIELENDFSIHFPCMVPYIAFGNNIENKPNEPLCHGCGAGISWCNISPEGFVSACGCLSDPLMYAGNVREQTLSDIWNNAREMKIWREIRELKGKCKICGYRYKCGGGCRAVAYLLTGDFLAEDPFCWLGPREEV